MKNLFIKLLAAFLPIIISCASMLGIDPDYLNKKSIYFIIGDKLEEKNGFDRLVLLHVNIIDKTKIFDKSTIVNLHFFRIDEKSIKSSQDNAVYSRGDWSAGDNDHQYTGVMTAQSKSDELTLDQITIGLVKSGKTERIDVPVNKTFITKKRSLNHLGTILVTIEDNKKYKETTITMDQTRKTGTIPFTISFPRTTEKNMQNDLEALKKKYPNVCTQLGNAFTPCF